MEKISPKFRIIPRIQQSFQPLEPLARNGSELITGFFVGALNSHRLFAWPLWPWGLRRHVVRSNQMWD